jgi:hypothetical protein
MTQRTSYFRISGTAYGREANSQDIEMTYFQQRHQDVWLIGLASFIFLAGSRNYEDNPLIVGKCRESLD